MVSGAGHCPHRHACHGKGLKGSKTMGLVQIDSTIRKEQVDEEPVRYSDDDSTPTLDVAEVNSSASTLLIKAAPPGGYLSNRTLLAPPGKDSSSKPSASVSVHPEAVSRGQQAYQGQASSAGAKLPLEFKRASMLLCDDMVRRLWQWHAFAANMAQHRSAAVVGALVAAGIIVFLVTFVALSQKQAKTSARSDHPHSGHNRGFSKRSPTPQQPLYKQVSRQVSRSSTGPSLSRQASRRSSIGQGTGPPLSRHVSSPDRRSSIGQGPVGTAEEHDTDSHFCPALVIPEECTLLVPTATLSQGPFDIVDETYRTVVHVEPRAQKVQPSTVLGGTDAEQRQQYRLVLTTDEGRMLAQCGPLCQAHECLMLQATDDLFANITGPEENAYTLTTRTDLELSFICTSEDYGWSVIDKSSERLVAKASKLPASGDTLSVASPQSSQGPPTYRVQMMPLMDVGLVLCGFLCIQHII